MNPFPTPARPAPSPHDLTGQIFGRLTARMRVGISSDGSVLWRCTCACGGTKTTRATLLRKGKTRSCGCAITTAAETRHFRERRVVVQLIERVDRLERLVEEMRITIDALGAELGERRAA